MRRTDRHTDRQRVIAPHKKTRPSNGHIDLLLSDFDVLPLLVEYCSTMQLQLTVLDTWSVVSTTGRAPRAVHSFQSATDAHLTFCRRRSLQRWVRSIAPKMAKEFQYHHKFLYINYITLLYSSYYTPEPFVTRSTNILIIIIIIKVGDAEFAVVENAGVENAAP